MLRGTFLPLRLFALGAGAVAHCFDKPIFFLCVSLSVCYVRAQCTLVASCTRSVNVAARPFPLRIQSGIPRASCSWSTTACNLPLSVHRFVVLHGPSSRCFSFLLFVAGNGWCLVETLAWSCIGYPYSTATPSPAHLSPILLHRPAYPVRSGAPSPDVLHYLPRSRRSTPSLFFSHPSRAIDSFLVQRRTIPVGSQDPPLLLLALSLVAV